MFKSRHISKIQNGRNKQRSVQVQHTLAHQKNIQKKELGYLSQLVGGYTEAISFSFSSSLYSSDMEIGRGTAVGCVLTLFQNNAAEYCTVHSCIQDNRNSFSVIN